MLDSGPLPASLEVRQPTQIHLWHRDQILPIIQNSPSALWDLCVLLAKRMRHASEMVEDLAFHPVTNRLARLLVKQYSGDAQETPVQRSLTLDEMATMIGTTPVMVCKILSRFADQGLIKVKTRCLFTHNPFFEFLDRINNVR